MPQIPDVELQIFPLTKRYILPSFKSTSSDLNDFLINNALEDQEKMISRTYIYFYKKYNFKEVDGYINTEFPKLYLNMYPIVAAIKPKESLEEFELG